MPTRAPEKAASALAGIDIEIDSMDLAYEAADALSAVFEVLHVPAIDVL